MGGIQKTTQPWYKTEKRSVRTYFSERCIGGHKANNFWHTVNSFLSKKSTGGQQKMF